MEQSEKEKRIRLLNQIIELEKSNIKVKEVDFTELRKLLFKVLKDCFQKLSELQSFGSQYYELNTGDLPTDLTTRELYIEYLLNYIKNAHNSNWKGLIENIIDARPNEFKKHENSFYSNKREFLF